MIGNQNLPSQHLRKVSWTLLRFFPAYRHRGSMALSPKDSQASPNLQGSCPFSFSYQLNNELDKSEGITSHSLPGYPRILLENRSKLRDFLGRHLISMDLEIMAFKLWWMSKQDSANVSPLHRQLVKKRKIIITEDPKSSCLDIRSYIHKALTRVPSIL